MIAIDNDHEDIVVALLNAGADVDLLSGVSGCVLASL